MVWVRRAAVVVLFGGLLAALALTALRITGPESGTAVRLVSFAPLALLLYAAGLVGCALVLVLRRLRSSEVDPGGRAVGVLAIVCAAGLGLHGWWLAPAFSGTSPTAASGTAPVRVLTVNLLKGQGDGTSVVELAVAAGVDILVLEEVTPSVVAEMRRAGLDQAFPHHAGEPHDGVTGTMVFTTGAVSQATNLHTTFGSWWVDIALEQGKVRLFAVHPSPPVDSAATWRADLARLRDAVAERHPDLVAGDFNATADHREFRDILAAGLRDAAERTNAGWQPTWPAEGEVRVLGVPLPRLVQIDHVLVGSRLTARSMTTVAVEGTDHRGVLAEVAFR